jgi:hypothetical protein
LSARLEAEILRLTELRGAGKSICPSEVARALHATDQPGATEGWQRLMTPVRHAAQALARDGRKGQPVDPNAEIRGVIRLRIKP